jgi:hypothetical protein
MLNAVLPIGSTRVVSDETARVNKLYAVRRALLTRVLLAIAAVKQGAESFAGDAA